MRMSCHRYIAMLVSRVHLFLVWSPLTQYFLCRLDSYQHVHGKADMLDCASKDFASMPVWMISDFGPGCLQYVDQHFIDFLRWSLLIIAHSGVDSSTKGASIPTAFMCKMVCFSTRQVVLFRMSSNKDKTYMGFCWYPSAAEECSRLIAKNETSGTVLKWYFAPYDSAHWNMLCVCRRAIFFNFSLEKKYGRFSKMLLRNF